MISFNITQALKYLNSGDLNQVQHYLELEKEEQETYVPVTRFSLEDLNNPYGTQKYNVEGMTAEDVAFIAGELWTDAMAEDYWLAVAYVMEERYPERLIETEDEDDEEQTECL